MSSIAFDTHRFVKRLTAAGMPEGQAEALAEEQARLVEDKLVTKRDLELAVTEIKGDIRLVKWMLALVIAATVLPLIRDLL